jgi:hypothetical protein
MKLKDSFRIERPSRLLKNPVVSRSDSASEEVGENKDESPESGIQTTQKHKTIQLGLSEHQPK